MINKKTKWLVLFVLIIATLFVWILVWQSGIKKLTVAFLDVGQGDAIFIETPHRRQVLFDIGPSKNIFPPLSKQMSFFDRSLDLILLSHGDSDHAGALKNILARFDIDYVLSGGWLKNESVSTDKFFLTPGTRIVLESVIYLDILGGGQTESKDNVDSLVARLRYGSTTFLLTGDAVAKEERSEVASLGSLLKVDVLKVAHHGSRTSSQLAFLQQVRPTYAVVSVGADNRYGHPTVEVLERLKKVGAEILRTDQEGTIVFESDGKNLIKK